MIHFRLSNKRVLITAGAQGIGEAISLRLIEAGGHVAIHYFSGQTRADGLVADAISRGLKAVANQGDLTDAEQAQHVVRQAADALGGLDVLVNNAGLGGMDTLVTMADETWQRILDVSLTGTMRCTRAGINAMMRDAGGAIINNASVLGWRAQKGQSHYAAAKAGVMALTRCAALEAAEHNIRINAVAPSLAMHPFLEKATGAELLESLRKREAFGRAAEVWEVANVIVFLANDLSSYMTGEIVPVSSQRA